MPNYHYVARLYDVGTSELLAEFDLNAMHKSLHPESVLPADLMEVQGACTAPDGRIGLIVLFSRPGSFTTDWGVWDGSSWQPLLALAPGGTRWQGAVYPGPSGSVASWPVPHRVQFSMPGKPYRVWEINPVDLNEAETEVSWRFGKLGLLAAIPALLVVCVLALAWLFIIRPPRRAA
jgi:hypothetical protein